LVLKNRNGTGKACVSTVEREAGGVVLEYTKSGEGRHAFVFCLAQRQTLTFWNFWETKGGEDVVFLERMLLGRNMNSDETKERKKGCNE
jgi:hypothetical protein